MKESDSAWVQRKDEKESDEKHEKENDEQDFVDGVQLQGQPEPQMDKRRGLKNIIKIYY